MPNSDGAADGQVIVLCGLPGVGKTTVGELIAERTGGRLLRTDVIRQELFAEPRYTDAETETVYGTLFDRASDVAGEGQSAILDGTFRDRGLRERAVEAAEAASVPAVFVKVTCEESTAVDRIRRRTDDESEADVEEHDHFREIFDPLEREHVTVDNSGSLEATRRQVANLF